MANINDYFFLTKDAKNVTSEFTAADDFYTKYNAIHARERKAYIRFYIINNGQFAFQKMPLLFERLVDYLSAQLNVRTSDIKLIGSAKTGFSISSPPGFGKSFGTTSDLDLSIINENIFFTLNKEFEEWASKYKSGKIFPSNPGEEKYWPNNLNAGANQLKNGYFDTKYIPNRDDFVHTRNIKVTARIYKNWDYFLNKLEFNTNDVMMKVKNEIKNT